jgi:hypothetical protein
VITLGLAVAAFVCGVVGLSTGRATFYGTAILCLAAIPLLGYLT